MPNPGTGINKGLGVSESVQNILGGICVIYGYNGKILHVNLSNNEITIENPDEIFYRTYMGGGCLGAYYLLKEMKPGVDPLSEENIIVFSPSILTGAPVAGLSRFGVVTKSPLTGAFLDSQAGGFWGPELKFAGYDAIVIKGKSPKPVYLWINDGVVEIKDASHLWGKVTGKVQEQIRKELNEPRARILTIGPAGEKLVKYACILSECKNANGRGGSGAVMGSKNLKAIACRGKNKLKYNDRQTLIDYAKWFSENYKDNPVNGRISVLGTAGTISAQQAKEELPSFNFSKGSIRNAENISGETMKETILFKREGCYACPVGCKSIVKAEKPYCIDPIYGGPEYEILAALGSNCGITDLGAVAKANELCNKYGLDTISTGLTISFAMECFEKGILSKEETDGLELKFGNQEAMLSLIEHIAFRKGKLGVLLAEGSKKAAEIIGRNVEDFAIHSKGLELGMHDPRVKTNVGLGYAVSPIGGDHVVLDHDPAFDEFAPQLFLDQAKPLGILNRLNAQAITPQKVRNFVYLQNHFSFMDSLTLCIFAFAPLRTFKMKHLINIMDAITGWETSLWELMKLGERRVNLARVFNYREGFRKADDKLPNRMFEKLDKAKMDDAQLNKDEFYKSIDLLYEMLNWQEDGKPRKAKLIELDIAWSIKEIY